MMACSQAVACHSPSNAHKSEPNPVGCEHFLRVSRGLQKNALLIKISAQLFWDETRPLHTCTAASICNHTNIPKHKLC